MLRHHHARPLANGFTVLTLALGMGSTSLPAHAQTGFYLGGSYGQSHFKDASPLGAPISGSTAGFKVYVGYSVNTQLSFELGHADLGTFQAGSNSLQSTGTFLDLVLTAPLGQDSKWSLLGRLGGFDNRNERIVNGSSSVDKGTNGKLGSGLQYNFNRSTALRGEWERYGTTVNGQTSNIDLYSLGMILQF